MHVPTIRSLTAALAALLALSTAHAFEVGAPAPPLLFDELLQAPDDADPSWEALRGKAVVLTFWTTESPGCENMLRNLDDLMREVRDQGDPVEFIHVTFDSRETLEPFLADHPIEGWIGLNRDSSLILRYRVHVLPRAILVDPEGRLVARTWPGSLHADNLHRLAQGQDPMLRDRFRMNETRYPDAVTINLSPPQVYATNVDARFLLGWAFGIPETRVQWPGFSSESRYDMFTSTEGTDEDLHASSQRDIADWLGVSVRTETRETAVYVLTLGSRGAARLREGEGNPPDIVAWSPVRYEATDQPLSSLAATLEYELGRPVLDETGLPGTFDFKLRWELGNRGKLVEQLRKKYGLVLTEEFREVDYLLVD